MPTPSPDWDSLFASLVDRPFQIALVCTGGGSGAIANCFRRSGASRNFVDAAIPYSRAASEMYLGVPPIGSHASKPFAQQLADAAFDRAVRLGAKDRSNAVGIALVAALPTEPPSEVEQRIHVALQGHTDRRTWSQRLEVGQQTRASAERIADQMVYDALASIATIQQ